MVKCPYCRAKVQVPAGVASLPRPQVPGAASEAERATPVGGPEEQEVLDDGQDALMGVMAKVMPWVISAFFHAGVLVILAFIVIVMREQGVRAELHGTPDLDVVERLTDRINPGQSNPELEARSLEVINQAAWSRRDSTVADPDTGETDKQISIYGALGDSAGGRSAPFGLTPGGSGEPRTTFFEIRKTAYYIIYIVDNSGSMQGTFDEVRQEMLRSIGRLERPQMFHVLFFSKDKFTENPARRLVPPTPLFTREAAKFLREVGSSGYGSSPIPALARAFELFKQLPDDRKGRLIYVLTDGEFDIGDYVYKTAGGRELTGNEAVLAWLRDHNKGTRQVQVNPILYNFKGMQQTVDSMRQIAKENRGDFKIIESRK